MTTIELGHGPSSYRRAFCEGCDTILEPSEAPRAARRRAVRFDYPRSSDDRIELEDAPSGRST
jgi:RNase P subunit RPR2